MSYAAEKGLAFLYPTAVVTSAVCCITSGIAWAHWRYILNACPDTNCGCFLHGRSTYNNFEGGPIGYCHFATFGMLFPLLFAIVLAIYHVYRVCMGTAKRKTGATTIRQRSGDMIVVTTESELSDNGISPYYWIPSLTIACIMVVFTLVYASIFTDGLEVTCKQFRENVLKEIHGFGHIVPVIKWRLSCAAIFDFMDYTVEMDLYERHRYGRINTAACVYMAVISAWVAVFSWIAIAVINAVQMRRTRTARI